VGYPFPARRKRAETENNTSKLQTEISTESSLPPIHFFLQETDFHLQPGQDKKGPGAYFAPGLNPYVKGC
jgi:hypothetical protein